jgi:predicted nucleic acid-binding protein
MQLRVPSTLESALLADPKDRQSAISLFDLSYRREKNPEVIYCDTSFLGALYLPGEKFEPVARQLASAFAEPMAFPWLSELELSNSVCRGAGRKIFSRRVGATILRQIARDKTAGLLFPCPLELQPHFRKAMELSQRFTPICLCRSLDVLHVAAAFLLGAGELVSFDTRQRDLAAKAGLKLLPETLP